MYHLALLFPGQGAQYPAMGKPWISRFPYTMKVFEEASDALGYDMAQLCLEGSADELAMTEKTQPALLTISYAAYTVYLREAGIQPIVAAGHSLGEISALTCAGAIGFTDALRIVQRRGKFMQKAVADQEGRMTAVVGMERNEVEQVCRDVTNAGNGCGIAVVSNWNAVRQVVVSGHRRAVEIVADRLSANGAQVIPLKVGAPFHSPLMTDAAQQFESYIRSHVFRNPGYPILSNVDGRAYSDGAEIADRLVKQLTSTVQWVDCMRELVKRGIRTTVELGPGAVLTNLMRMDHPAVAAFSADRSNELSDFIRKANISFMERCLSYAASTENRNPTVNRDVYRIGVIDPYRKLERMLEGLEAGGEILGAEDRMAALNALSAIWEAKSVQPEERGDRMATLIRMGGHS